MLTKVKIGSDCVKQFFSVSGTGRTRFRELVAVDAAIAGAAMPAASVRASAELPGISIPGRQCCARDPQFLAALAL